MKTQHGDVPVLGGLARPYTGSSLLKGFWLAVRPDGTVVFDGFGKKYFADPAAVSAHLAADTPTNNGAR